MQGQAPSAFSMLSYLLRRASGMLEVPSVPHAVPAGCKVRCFERRNGHTVFMSVTPSFLRSARVRVMRIPGSERRRKFRIAWQKA